MAKVKQNLKAVVIYLRVSTEEQGKSHLGLDAQLAQCQRLAEYEELEILGVFKEVASGKTDPMTRTAFKEAIALAQKNGARLMISKLDRMSRDIFYISSFINGFMIKNCPKLIIAENPNASEFEINLRASLAQEERRLISERTKAALAVKRKQGFTLGAIGRATVTATARQKTEGAIKRAKELRNDNLSLEKICEILNKEGYKTSRDSLWTKQALSKRIKN